MQLRPLSNKTWASIFILAAFLVAMYIFNGALLTPQTDGPDGDYAAAAAAAQTQ